MLSKRALLLLVLFQGAIFLSFADRGVGKKSKTSKISLDIRYKSGNIENLGLNLKTGLRYTGNIVTSSKSVRTNLVTYEKGNTLYIVPQKQKILVPEYQPGYTGLKLIIKKN